MSRLIQHDRRQLAKYPSLLGIDEAGRGCLAGPVSAGAVWLDATFFSSKLRRQLAGTINDSKKLSAEDRDEIYHIILGWEERGMIRCATAMADVMEIDAYNILGATRLAMHRCVQTLVESHEGPCPFATAASGDDVPLFSDNDVAWPRMLVDGKPLKPFAWQHHALVGGDGKSLSIAMASILAKVRRDRLMEELDRAYPKYGFATHKGYATPEHITAIKAHGPCPEHRPLFLRSILNNPEGQEEDHLEFSF
ncbi:MAG: ribonuclease HII [Puniceicoccales bacterium]|jgi:ribonuclease HII|nr:ribonuclease HII [Puniceicoccales bacterium]